MWKLVKPSTAAPNPLYGHSSVFDASARKLYVIGGFNGTWYQSSVWAFTVATGATINRQLPIY